MHRDIKPENIMFKKGSLEAEDVTLVDFGLSTFDNP
jgi:serine/threonine protein kinase